MKDLLQEFIDWLHYNAESVDDIFENTDELIERFINQREED